MEISENFKALSTNTEVSKEYPEETVSKMSFHEIRVLRDKVGDTNKEAQDYLGPYDRRSYTREWVERGGVGEALKAAILVPAEGIVKGLGITSGRSEGSLEAVKQGFIGIGEGLKAYFGQEEEKPQQKETEKPKDTMAALIENLIQTESSGRHKVDGELLTSNKGAKGITQVMHRTGKNPGYGIKPLQNDSEEEYIRFGKDYVTKMIQVFDDIEQGVAAYNAGPGAIHRAISKAERTGKHWKEFIPKETQKYIEKVVPKEEEEKVQPHKPQMTDIMGFRG